MTISHLLLGTNLGDRLQNLTNAAKAINKVCGIIKASSAVYETEAWGLKEQGAFLNQALRIETDLGAEELLKAILEIEQSLGRIRAEKYGPRTIDIDILFYGDRVIELPHLIIPHPFLPKRRFALTCLADVSPVFVHPFLKKTVQQLLDECADSSEVYKF